MVPVAGEEAQKAAQATTVCVVCGEKEKKNESAKPFPVSLRKSSQAPARELIRGEEKEERGKGGKGNTIQLGFSLKSFHKRS